MRKRTHLASGAAAVLALTFATPLAAAANDFRDPCPHGQSGELTVVQRADDGYAYGHRSSRKVRHLLFDLEPRDGRAARKTRKGLKFQMTDIQFGFKRTSDDTLRATRRHKGRKTTRDVHRTDEPIRAPKVVLLPGDE